MHPSSLASSRLSSAGAAVRAWDSGGDGKEGMGTGLVGGTGAEGTEGRLDDGGTADGCVPGGRQQWTGGHGSHEDRMSRGGGLFQQPLRCHHPLAVTTSPSCPLFPTELVLVLETSSTVSPALFSRMKELLALLLRDLQISPLGCPAGARVAMLAYAATPTYLLRAGEMGSRTALLDRLRRLSPTRSSRRGRLATAMRFVGHHVLKRVRPATLGRKVVLFVTSGRNQNLEGIGEVALQYEALGIVPAVLTFSPLPEVVRAFQVSLGPGGCSPRSLVSPPQPSPFTPALPRPQVNSLFRVVQLSATEPAGDAAVLRDAVLPCILCFGRQPQGCTGDGCQPAPGLSLHLFPSQISATPRAAPQPCRPLTR